MLGKEEVEMERMEVRNQDLRQEEDFNGTAVQKDVTTDVVAGHDLEEIHKMAKVIREAGLEVHGLAKKISQGWSEGDRRCS